MAQVLSWDYLPLPSYAFGGDPSTAEAVEGTYSHSCTPHSLPPPGHAGGDARRAKPVRAEGEMFRHSDRRRSRSGGIVTANGWLKPRRRATERDPSASLGMTDSRCLRPSVGGDSHSQEDAEDSVPRVEAPSRHRKSGFALFKPPG
jgi:hypothetical protein